MTIQAGGDRLAEINSSSHVHLRLKTHGNQLKREFFNFLCGWIDSDWPQAPEELQRYSRHSRFCTKCGGDIWANPAFDLVDLAHLADQVDQTDQLPGKFGVKVKALLTQQQCAEGRKK